MDEEDLKDRRAKQFFLAVLAVVVGVIALPFLFGASDPVTTVETSPSLEASPRAKASPRVEAVPAANIPVEGGEAYENLVKQVFQSNPDASWLVNITQVRKGSKFLFYDLFVTTDLDEDSATDTEKAIGICNGFASRAIDGTRIIVNGLKHQPAETQIDGSVKQQKPESSKMADANPGTGRPCARA